MKTHFAKTTLWQILLVVILSAGAGNSLCADTLFSPSDSRINYYGRFDMSNPSRPLFNWSGSIIETSFYGPLIGIRLVCGNADYDIEIDNLLDTVSGVANNSVAKITWSDLAYNKTYSWYAVASDSSLETRSDSFNFKTREKDNTPPNVSFEKPTCTPKCALYIRNIEIPLGFLRYPLIFGRFTIKINAEDEQTGIAKVEVNITRFNSDKTEIQFKDFGVRADREWVREFLFLLCCT